jgi:uncharacterized repeat protein (TIGR03803 family)
MTILRLIVLSCAVAIYIASAAASTPEYETLYAFSGPTDGDQPQGTIAVDGNGVLYGTTFFGGDNEYGIVFSLTPPASQAGQWAEAIVWQFPAMAGDGVGPRGGLVMGSGGVLYGTTVQGGSAGHGTVFSLTPPAAPGAAWSYNILYNFQGSGDGITPGSLAIGTGGVLYGTTEVSAASSNPGNGGVFSLTPPASPGGTWSFAVLWQFAGAPTDGAFPSGTLAIGAGGVLYGTTTNGGEYSVFGSTEGEGAAYSLTPPTSPGGPWTEALLWSFGGAGDGARPNGFAIGSNGTLYTTTTYGPNGNIRGTVATLTPPASPGGAWSESLIYRFKRNVSAPPHWPDGEYPRAGVLVDPATGNVYGTTENTVFRLEPPRMGKKYWRFAVLESYGKSYSFSPPVIGQDGYIYGTTLRGPHGRGQGTVFAVAP